MAAKSTYMTYLMYKATSAATQYTKLCDIKSYPNLGGAPERLETTTLSNSAQTFTDGIQQLDSFTFTANFDKADLTTLEGLKGKETDFAVWFGGTTSNGVVVPDGSDGKTSFKGLLSAYPTGKGVNEVREMEINISTTTEPTFAAS